MNANVKTGVFWGVIIMVVVLLWTVVRQTRSRPEAQPSFSQFLDDVNAKKVKSVTITGNDVHGVYNGSGEEFRKVAPLNYPKLVDLMKDNGVAITYGNETNSNWVSILINAIPFVLLLAFWIFMIRQMQSGGKKTLSFGRSRALVRLCQQEQGTFNALVGLAHSTAA